MMYHPTQTTPVPADPPVSLLVLSDRMLTLAEEADRAGYSSTAKRLLQLACRVFDEAPRPAH